MHVPTRHCIHIGRLRPPLLLLLPHVLANAGAAYTPVQVCAPLPLAKFEVGAIDTVSVATLAYTCTTPPLPPRPLASLDNQRP
jgi:hypothetical protein